MAGYLALRQAPEGAAMTVVHDYAGVGTFMTGEAKPKNPIMKSVVSACGSLVDSKELALKFVHRHGHGAWWAGRVDPARLNARAHFACDEGRRTLEAGVTIESSRRFVDRQTLPGRVAAVVGLSPFKSGELPAFYLCVVVLLAHDDASVPADGKSASLLPRLVAVVAAVHRTL